MEKHESYVANNSSDDIDLREVFGIILAAKKVITVFAVVATFIGVIYVWVSAPVYQVDAILQVEDGKGSALGGAVKDLDGLLEVKSQATTEIEILRSRMVLGRSVDALSLDIVVAPNYFPLIGRAIARRHTDQKPSSGLFGLRRFAWGGEALVVTRLQVPEEWLGQEFKLVALAAGKYKLLDPSGSPLGEGEVGREFKSKGLGVFVRELDASVGVEFYLKKLPRLAAIGSLSRALVAIEKGKQSGIIQISMESENPSLAVRQINAIADQYVRQNVERKSAEADQTLKYLEQQLPDTKNQLEAAEIRFNDYRSKNKTVDVNKEGDLILQQSVATETGLVALQQKKNELLRKFTVEHPSIKALDDQIATLLNERKKVANQVDELPQTQQEILRLTRDLQVNQQIYMGLLNNSQQLKVVRGGTVGNVRVLDYAERPLKPVKPLKAIIIIFSALVGFVAGAGYAIAKYLLRSGIKDPSIIEARTGLSVFATIPKSETQASLFKQRSRIGGEPIVLALKDDQDLAVESLRGLRTTLHFASLDASNNRLLVTGPAPGVGKSFISVNLAAVLVASGERVLIIDADMRRGHINEYFGRERSGGLSDLIAGSVSLEVAIQKTGIDGLDLLTTGAIPPNPSELLLHSRFSEILDQISERYDRVIIDCPPIMAVTDAAIVGRYTDTVLLTARFSITPIAELEAAVSRLAQAGVKVNGVLLNGVEDLAGYGYGYGYKYAYSYSYRSSKD